MSNLYFIALVPNQNIRQKVFELKNEMREKYGAAHALKSPAHITLVMPFRRKEAEEELFCRVIRETAADMKPFFIELEDFDVFAQGVIFIKVKDHENIIEVRKNLVKNLRNDAGFSPKETGSRFHPHMTIATRDLTEENFDSAWKAFSERTFQEKWLCESISILKHNGKHWDIYNSYPLMSQ
ncbi:MAG: 2'-5' RNA ligase family protein [Saprospirales bacterium]|nr:MAG: 2'-5' RNA ligase family protein [Saprospirales bacterium]